MDCTDRYCFSHCPAVHNKHDKCRLHVSFLAAKALTIISWLLTDYYYGDQEYKMKASEWTRRADVDSGDEYDERRARAIYQSVPGGSRHIKQGVRWLIKVILTPLTDTNAKYCNDNLPKSCLWNKYPQGISKRTRRQNLKDQTYDCLL